MATEKINTSSPAATEAQVAKNDGKGWPERAIEVSYDFHAGKDESPTETFGEETVNHFFYKGAKVFIQQRVRGWLRQGKSDDDIQKLVSELVLTTTTGTRLSASDRIMKEFGKLSKDQILEVLKRAKNEALV